MYRRKTVSIYFFSIPQQQTVFISTKRYILRQHKTIISKLYGTKIRIRRLKFKRKTFTAEFNAFVQQLQNFGINLINVADKPITPYILQNVRKNSVFSSKTAILNYILSKLNLKVKSIIQLKDSESILINKNIKLTFIRVPYYDLYTFKLKAPYQYLQRLYQ